MEELTIEAGQAIALRFGEGADAPRFPSRIVYVSARREVGVQAPREEGEEVEVAPGARLVLEVGQPDGMRLCSAVVRERRPTDPPTLWMDWPTRVERIQRRNHVRVQVEFPVDLEYRPAAGERITRVRARAADMSAGGVRLVVPEPIATGVSMQMRLHLEEEGEDDPVLCRGTVVSAGGGVNPGGRQVHWNGVQFTEIDERDRREITRRVFDIQRELLRRGID